MQKLLYTRRWILLAVSLLIFLGTAIYLVKTINSTDVPDDTEEVSQGASTEEVFYEGVITYVNPHFYPEDDISYVLTDRSGEDIILLKASDQILVATEGMYAKVYGNVAKTKDRKSSVLVVERVVINNVPN